MREETARVSLAVFRDRGRARETDRRTGRASKPRAELDRGPVVLRSTERDEYGVALQDRRVARNEERDVAGGVAEEERELLVRRPGGNQLVGRIREQKVDVDLKYVGFEIPPEFVVGYGLDYAERFRNLPYVATLKPAAYQDSPE